MAVIKTQKVPGKKPESWEDTVARFCYYYPQYKYHQARVLPLKRVNQMLRIAKNEYARKMIDLVQAVSAPHSKKGKGVRKMLEYFKSIIED